VFLCHFAEECASLALRRDAAGFRADARAAWLALEAGALAVFLLLGVCFGFTVPELGCKEDGDVTSIAEYLIFLSVMAAPGFRALD